MPNLINKGVLETDIFGFECGKKEEAVELHHPVRSQNMHHVSGITSSKEMEITSILIRLDMIDI